jgi:hypothetical protein
MLFIAQLKRAGNAVSHRFRDTLAVLLLAGQLY